MTMVVRMAMIVSAMPVIMSAVPVVVSVMGVSEREEADHVDQEAKRTHDEKLFDTPQLPTFQHTFSGLPDKLHTDQHEEDSISESRKRVEFAPAIRHLRAGWPFGSNSCAKTNDKAQAIEKHMYSVTKKTERATQVAVQALNKHECKVETVMVLVRISMKHGLPEYNIPCEIANSPGVLFNHNAVYKRARLTVGKNKFCERRALSLDRMMMASINIVRMVVVVVVGMITAAR